jgi:hypothetical protein
MIFRTRHRTAALPLAPGAAPGFRYGNGLRSPRNRRVAASWPLGRIVKDDAEPMPMARTDHADAVTRGNAVVPSASTLRR